MTALREPGTDIEKQATRACCTYIWDFEKKKKTVHPNHLLLKKTFRQKKLDQNASEVRGARLEIRAKNFREKQAETCKHIVELIILVSSFHRKLLGTQR